MGILSSILGGAVEKALGVVDEFVTDKDQANQLKNALRVRIQDSADKELKAKSEIIQSEASGESWLQRNWRPTLMLVIVAIVANNYLVAPYLQAMFGVGLTLDLPERMWDLMTLGVGGYIGGQTAERVVGAVQARKAAKDRGA